MSTTTTTPSKIRVAIIGAGIAGLTAALALQKWPQYSITVYERRSLGQYEPAAGFGIREHGITVLRKLGVDIEDMRGVEAVGYRAYNIKGEETNTSFVRKGSEGEGTVWLLVRKDLRDLLIQRLTSTDNGKVPVKLQFDSNVASVEAETGIVRFTDDASIQADLVIGADGIHSRVRPAVIPASHPAPVPSGMSLYRFDLPMKDVQDLIGPDEQAQAIFKPHDDGVFCSLMAAGNEDARHMVMYPCRGFEQANFAFAVPDSSLENTNELKYSWNAEGKADDMLKVGEGFPRWLLRIIGRASNVGLFQVRDLEPLPTYFAGRTVLIGDAAHAMVPYQGQGANQALEDVDGLDELLADVHDAERIPKLLELWDSVRRPRVTEIQRHSRESLGKVSSKGSSESILSVKPHVSVKEALKQRANRTSTRRNSSHERQ